MGFLTQIKLAALSHGGGCRQKGDHDSVVQLPQMPGSGCAIALPISVKLLF